MSILTTIINHWDDIAAVGALLGGVFWKVKKGQKAKSAREILEDVVRNVLYSDGVDLNNVKTRAETAIRAALTKHGLKGKAADVLVHEFVEYAAAELAERFDLFTKNLERMYEAAKGVEQAFDERKTGKLPRP